MTDPRVDHQAIHEASYVNIPVIALADTDAPLQYVSVAIPTNSKVRHAINLIWWLLAREVLRLRSTIPRTPDDWNVMVDIFFERDPEEVEKQQQEEAAREPTARETVAEAVTEWDVAGGATNPALVGVSAKLCLQKDRPTDNGCSRCYRLGCRLCGRRRLGSRGPQHIATMGCRVTTGRMGLKG